jgi:hypothetical protein
MVDLPNLQINGNAVEKPHGAPIPSIRVYTPEAMTPRVMTPEVTTPQVDRPQIAQLPSPLRELSNSLAKASDESNDVAKLFAKQAGLQAVTRDDDGNLVIAKAPIVGDAAVAYQAAVKYTALAFGQNEAKQKFDLVLSKQFQGNPDGYLKAAEAFRKAHVNEFTKSAGPEVGAELSKSILNDTTVNYRWLVLDQQKKIAHAVRSGHAGQDCVAPSTDIEQPGPLRRQPRPAGVSAKI